MEWIEKTKIRDSPIFLIRDCYSQRKTFLVNDNDDDFLLFA